MHQHIKLITGAWWSCSVVFGRYGKSQCEVPCGTVVRGLVLIGLNVIPRYPKTQFLLRVTAGRGWEAQIPKAAANK